MKKVILSLVLFATGITAFAAPSAAVRISHDVANVTIRQDVPASSFEAFGSPYIVLNVSGTKYSQWKAADIEGMAIDYIPTATSFNFTFDNVIGDLYLVDNVANTRTLIVEGATYPVTATAAEVAAAAYISGRFSISKLAAKGICFKNNTLELTLYNGWKVEVYEETATTPTISKNVAADYETINLDDKMGRYIVKVTKAGETDEEYFIDVHPEKDATKYKWQVL